MTDLLDHAEKLASEPPTLVYKALTTIGAQTQLKLLGNPPPVPQSPDDPAYKKQQALRAKYDKDKADWEDYADNWTTLSRKYGEDVARFTVTAICDFTAMCMMMIAAGIPRIEALKTAIRQRDRAGCTELQNKSGDCAWLFDRKSAGDFLAAMETWCGKNANGIVQFKFPANGDFHTFAVERARASNGRREFIVYQSYEGTYTLSHFLHQTDVWNDDTLHKIYDQRWASMPEHTRKLYHNDFKVYGSKVLVPKMDNIELAMKWTGSGQHHSYDDLYNLVLFPLDMMLTETCPRDSYIRMTGSPSTDKEFTTPYLIALMCNELAPDSFAANRTALYSNPQGLTEYASCGMKV